MNIVVCVKYVPDATVTGHPVVSHQAPLGAEAKTAPPRSMSAGVIVRSQRPT